MKWPMVSLGELLTLERRPIKIEPDKQYTEIGIYCFGRGIFHKSPRSGLEVGNKDLFLIKDGDFILQVTFAWEGAVGLVSSDEDGLYGSTRFPTFRVNASKCNSRYLLNYFKTREGREQLVKISPGSVGRNRVLSLKRIPEVLVPLPPLPEQKRIMALIEELAAKVEEAKGLRQKAGEEAEAVSHAFLKSLIESEEAQVWAMKYIPEVADINPSRQIAATISDNTQVSFVPMSAVDDITGKITRPEIRHLCEVRKGYTFLPKAM